MYLDNDRRPTLTPQLAARVAIIGGVALVAFAVIFFRLWYLQVLSGDRYLAEANDNRVREIKVQAPRGEIVDRDGRPLVDNRPSMAVVLSPEKLPDNAADRQVLYRRLGKLLSMRPQAIRRDVEPQLKALPYSTATVKQDVSDETAYYMLEHQDEFRGADVERVFLRKYRHGSVGAHLFGTVGEMTPEQEKDPSYRDVDLGDRVGQSGVELEYDRFLRGRNGASRVQVDALGNLNRPLKRREPKQGRQLRLAVDLDVQKAGQEALAGGTGRGAFAVMDVHNGEVLGLGSQPSFDPNVFSKGIGQAALDRLQDPDLGAPLTNRAVQGGYPTGSTFKLITATAALEGGLITPDSVLNDPRLVHHRRGHLQQRRGRGARGAGAAPGAHGVERRVLLPARRPAELERQRPGPSALGPPLRHRARHGHRPPRGAARAAAHSEVAQRPLRQGRDREAVDAGRQREPLGRPG